MITTTRTSGYRIEVAPYEQAAWVPRVMGATFRWAWRILDKQGVACLVGACAGSKENARQLAEAAIERLDSSTKGDAPRGSSLANNTNKGEKRSGNENSPAPG